MAFHFMTIFQPSYNEFTTQIDLDSPRISRTSIENPYCLLAFLTRILTGTGKGPLRYPFTHSFISHRKLGPCTVTSVAAKKSRRNNDL